MARILAVTWEGGGNVPPMLGITARLRERGHHVRVLGHAVQRESVEATGATFVPYRHARPWSATGATSGLRQTRDLFALFTETGPARDVDSEIAAPGGTDLVLVDCMRLSALRAAVHSDVPTVALVHTFHHYLTRRWARGPIGCLATLRGLRPAALWDAADRVLVATDRELDPAGPPEAGNVRYVGVAQAVPRPPDRGATPTVLVSLSTISYATQGPVLQHVLDALAAIDVHVIAATGPDVDPRDLGAGANTEVHRHLSHEELMPAASLLVGHGGHATTMRALAHGIPVLTIPLHPQLDQPMIGTAVEAAGAGLALDTRATPAQIRDAARSLLADGPHRAAALSIGDRIRATDGAAGAVDEIEAVLRQRSDDGSVPHTTKETS